MFNLLMFNVDWKAGRTTIPIERIFEHTDKDISDRFRENGKTLFNNLITLPCLFCNEGISTQEAYVGRITNVRLEGRNATIQISIDTDAPILLNEMLYENREHLDMPDRFEFSRSHWAVKDVDLYRFLLLKTSARRQRPKVFHLPDHERIDSTLASAMMPFSPQFNEVYDTIRAASNAVGLTCKRADDIWENASIIQDVVALIDRSRIVVCDCSGRNPNVFYEAGIAHTLGREVILITQSEHDIPFDLRHLRYVKYLNNVEGRTGLAQSLQARMQTLLGC